MAGIGHRGFMGRKKGRDCSSYIPGKYTVDEINQMVFVDGYIPVANATEFDNIRTGSAETMGAGTCWENQYTTGANKKYVQVLDIDFTAFGTWTNNIVLSTGFRYDGNELVVSNISATNLLFSGSDADFRNMRLGACSHTSSIVGAALLYSGNTLTAYNIEAELITVFSDGFNVSNSSTGGLFGSIGGFVDVDGIYFDGSVEGARNVIGGVFGSCESVGGAVGGTIQNISNSATTTVTCTGVGTYGIIGGIGGVVRGVSATNCINNAAINGAVRTGGVFGDFGTILGDVATACVNNANISSINGYTGGCFGNETSTGIFISCVNYGDIAGGGITGGVMGTIGDSRTVSKCVNYGDVSTTSTDRCGGVIGTALSQTINVSECANIRGNVTSAGEGAGGLIGECRAQLQNCYSLGGTITGTGRVGGLCGHCQGSSAVSVWDNCYSTSIPVSAGTKGGLCGQVFSGTLTVNNSYWDTVTSGIATSPRGVGKTTSELQTPTSNTGIYSAWTIPPWDFGTSSEYPVLSGVADELPDGSIVNGIMVVEMGQSNMEGRFGDSPLHTSTEGTAYFWNGSSIEHLVNNRGGATGGSHATYFANKLYTLASKKPIMLEVATGGAGLGSDSGSGNNNYGASGNKRGHAETQVSDCIAAIPNITAPTAGLWCQGERDAQQMDSEPTYTRADVKAAMQDVIDWWQATYPGVPFLISQTGRPNGADTTGFADMRDIQQEIVDENTDVYMAFTGAVNFPAEGKMGDSLHYNFEGLQDMGEAFADTLAGLL